MEYMYNIRNMLCDELEEMSKKKQISIADIDIIHKLTDTIKNIFKIEMLQEEDGKYSQEDGNGYSREDGYSDRRNSRNSYKTDLTYDDGEDSYRRGRNQMGQFTSRESGRRYSRDGGKEKMISQLHNMMETAETDRQKESIKKLIRDIENS